MEFVIAMWKAICRACRGKTVSSWLVYGGWAICYNCPMKILLLSFLCMGTLGAAVVENAPGYNAWPMIQAVDGKLICTYSRGSGHSIGEDGTQTDAAVYVEPVRFLEMHLAAGASGMMSSPRG